MIIKLNESVTNDVTWFNDSELARINSGIQPGEDEYVRRACRFYLPTIAKGDVEVRVEWLDYDDAPGNDLNIYIDDYRIDDDLIIKEFGNVTGDYTEGTFEDFTKYAFSLPQDDIDAFLTSLKVPGFNAEPVLRFREDTTPDITEGTQFVINNTIEWVDALYTGGKSKDTYDLITIIANNLNQSPAADYYDFVVDQDSGDKSYCLVFNLKPNVVLTTNSVYGYSYGKGFRITAHTPDNLEVTLYSDDLEGLSYKILN